VSWSLQIRNGDLVVDQRKVGVVTGWQKLLQDLRCHLLERLGNDSMHPEFGSVLDGGVGPGGVEIEGIIGEIDEEVARSFIATEVGRIITEHQQKQLDRARSDQMGYGKHTLLDGELLESAEVNVGFQGDVMVVQIIISTSAGDAKRISLPFTLT
jgi:hypothetical protein